MNQRLRALRVPWAAGTLFFLLAPASWLAAAESREVFHVRDYGAVAGSQDDSGGAIRAAIKAAMDAKVEAEIVLDAGTYRAGPADQARYCFPLARAADLVIRGAGETTKIVVTDPTVGVFLFALCQRVTLRDLTIDYDPLPYCQGAIRAVDAAAGHFDLEVAADYPTPDADNFVNAMEPYGKWGMIIDPTTRRIREGTPDHFMTPRWEHRDGRVWRFFTTQEPYRRNLQHMRVGDAYVHLARGYGAAVIAQACENVTFENIVVRASPGLAVGLVANKGEIIVHGLQVRFPPDTNRLLTTNADGVHCQQNRTGPVIEGCYFEGMADDAINIYAPPNVLREVRSAHQWLVSPNCLVLPGDRLQVLDPRTGVLRGQVTARTVQAEGRAFLLTIDTTPAGPLAGSDHRTADTLYNLDACGAGYQIRNNHMHGNRRYGCLLRAGGGVVEDNLFEDTTGAGVVATNEPDWPEGPVPWDITIRNNRFVRGGTCLGYADSPYGSALTVKATRLGHRLAEAESIHHVVIEGNQFIDRAGAAIFIGGARDVTLSQNQVRAAQEVRLRRSGGAIIVDRSSNVAIINQQIADPREGTTAAVEILRDTPSGDAVVRVENLGADLAPGAPALLDHR